MHKKLITPTERDPRWNPREGDRLHLQSGGGFLVEVVWRNRLWLEVMSDPDDPSERWRHHISIQPWRRIATGALVVVVAPSTPTVSKVPYEPS